VRAAVDEEGAYHLKGSVVGSALRQVVLSGTMPFDKTYAELTSDQKAVLASDYEELPPGDEPPFPIYGVGHLVRPLMSFVEAANVVGPLVASVLVDSQGDAVRATVYKAPDPALAQLASSALSTEKYKPGVCKGQPCRMEYVLRLYLPMRSPGLPVDELRIDPATGNFGRR
jgi:hypothetical protein